MTTDTAPAPFAGPRPAALRLAWGWMIALGVTMVVLGTLGLGMAYRLTRAGMFWFGIPAIAAGVLQLLDVVHHRGWKSVPWHVLIAFVYLVASGFMVAMPVKSAFPITLVLALSLVAAGVMRLFIAFEVRRSGGPWLGVLLIAPLAVALGLFVYGAVAPPSPEVLATPEGQVAWLLSWGPIIGMFVSIELLAQGLSRISLGSASRTVARGTDRMPAGA